MGGDERRPLAAGTAESRLDPVVDGNEGAAADSQGMRSEKRVEIVVGQLEAGQEEQAVIPGRARRPVASISARYAAWFPAWIPRGGTSGAHQGRRCA